MTSPKEQVLAILIECDIELPDDGLTLAKIRRRGWNFRLEEDASLAFTLERHPTMYLSEMQLAGQQQSPARFHVLTDYRLEFDKGTWHIDERDATFHFEPHLVIEAELDALGRKRAMEELIEEIKTAEQPETAFEEAFASWIRHWEDMFADVHGRPVPADQQQEILRLLVDELRSRTNLD